MNNLPNKKTEFTFLLVRVPSLGQHSGETPELRPQNADQERERPKGYAARYALALASCRAPRDEEQGISVHWLLKFVLFS